VSGQYWTGPYQLTTSPGADVNPSACKEWLGMGDLTCMAWQTNRAGNWDIYAKFCTFQQGNGWGPDEVVCADTANDVNPSVAAVNDWQTDHPSFWCVWERRVRPDSGVILASFITFRDQWGPAQRVGSFKHTGADSAKPGIIVIRRGASDTTWVVWACEDSGIWYVEYSYNTDSVWSTPGIIVAQREPIHDVRLGRGKHGQYYGCPLVVWESAGDIYYSEYRGASWTVPAQVAPSPAIDRNADILSYGPYTMSLGPWITWESTREGDTAVFGTAMDTFSIARRWCDSTGAGDNYSPCGTPAEYTTDLWGPLATTWVSDRDGNPNIYSRLGLLPYPDVPVDTNHAQDLHPTLTTLDVTMHWCCWQSDRSGNWDLWGSYVYMVGLAEERDTPQAIRRTQDPTIVRGSLNLQLPISNRQSAELLDASGRRVADLRPGANDVSRLAPGLYFVWRNLSFITQHSAFADVAKVIIAK